MRIICIVILVLLLPACSSKPYAEQAVKKVGISSAESSRHKVFLVGVGWHTGFVLPIVDMVQKLPKLKQRFAYARYLEFGWGDRNYYQNQAEKIALKSKVVLWPTESIVHVVAIPGSPNEHYTRGEIVELCLDDYQYHSLQNYIAASFSRDSAGNIIESLKGYSGDSHFYEAIGKYHLLNTCNTWTAKGLRSAGMDIWPNFTLSATSVMDYIREELSNSDGFGEPNVRNRSSYLCAN